MSDQVLVAVVSGGFALLVALLGIAGAVAAQLVATRRAFANSLALFERQAAQAERERAEAARLEGRSRFVEQKRSTYGRVLRLADELVDAREGERTAAKYADRTMITLDRVGDQSDNVARVARDYADAAEENHRRAVRLASELAEVVDEVHLLCEDEVRLAAQRLRESAGVVTHTEDAGYVAARTGFIAAARAELDVRPR